MKDLITLVNQLRAYRTECEWFEFKVNWFEPAAIGEYISAISNSKACTGRTGGYFIWGINNTTHEIDGIPFDPNCDVKSEPLKHYLARQISPENNFDFTEVTIDGKRVVVLRIPAAKTVPTSFRNERYIRIGSSKENIRKYPEKESFLFRVLGSGFPTIENTPSDYSEHFIQKQGC